MRLERLRVQAFSFSVLQVVRFGRAWFSVFVTAAGFGCLVKGSEWVQRKVGPLR